MTVPTPSSGEVKGFWEKNPVASLEIPHAVGTPEYLDYFDKLRDDVEPIAFAREVYEFDRFQGKTVLEVGCGNGYVLSRYAAAGAEVTGVDITETGVELCRKRFQMSGLKGTFLVANAEKLPFPDEVFDCVCSMGVLHHVPDTEKAVKEIFRVLKPGGRLIVMMYHRNSILYRWKFPLLSKLQGKSMQQLVNEVDGPGNPKGDVYSRDELKALLRDFTDHDFVIGCVQGFMLIPLLGKYIPTRWLRFLERRWGWYLYARARKRNF
jgi:ubiquinone/menaquinone biosynthesis C-methylase UbiE